MNPTECRILPDASIRLYPEMTGFNMTSKLLLPMFVTAKINGNYLSCRLPRER